LEPINVSFRLWGEMFGFVPALEKTIIFNFLRVAKNFGDSKLVQPTPCAIYFLAINSTAAAACRSHLQAAGVIVFPYWYGRSMVSGRWMLVLNRRLGGSWQKAKPMEVPSIADQFGSNLSCKLVLLCFLCPPTGDKDMIVDRSKKLSCASIAFPCARR